MDDKLNDEEIQAREYAESEVFWQSEEGKRIAREAIRKGQEFYRDFCSKCHIPRNRLREPFTI